MSRLVSTMLLVSMLSLAAQAQGTWQDLPPLTQPRQETGAARIGDNVYVCGGLAFDQPRGSADTIEVYSISGNSWSNGPNLPVALDHMGFAALDGYLYVVGGYGRTAQGGADPQDAVYRMTPDGSEWEPLAPLPTARGGLWVVAHRGKLYAFGGLQPGVAAYNDTLIYDPALNTWEYGEPMSTPRDHLNAVSAGMYIYVCGGRFGSTSYTLMERYDPKSDTWETMEPMNNARAAMAMAAYGSKIYCMGGETPMLFSVNEVYDIVSNTWSIDTAMAIPRHGIAAVTIPGGILCPAGGIVQGYEPTNAADLFVPDMAVEDVNGEDGVNAVDVQLVINSVLGLDVGVVNTDIDADGELTASDVQRAINGALQ